VAVDQVQVAVQDLLFVGALLGHEVDRHGSESIERPVCGCCGEVLGVAIT